MMAAPLQAADSIGNITELKGNARVVRDTTEEAALEAPIRSYDSVETSNGRMSITFLDDTLIKLTEHSKVLIDEFIFDPDPAKSKMALNFAKGTARFVTSKLGKVAKENISIRTESATVGIRGTDFTITVDEIGRSLVILLPNQDGTSSGEIIVETAMGLVILNKPFESTVTNVYEQAPTKPVILDLSLDFIDNMLIVNPPQRTQQLSDDATAQTNNVLDVDLLEFNELEQDYLAEDNLEFTELDINFLDVNFFEDMLKIMDELDKLSEDDLEQEQTVTRITGTAYGQDTDTQIISLIEGGVLTLTRAVEQSVKVTLDGSQGYTVLFIQNGISNTVKINGGGDSVIKITQGS